MNESVTYRWMERSNVLLRRGSPEATVERMQASNLRWTAHAPIDWEAAVMVDAQTAVRRLLACGAAPRLPVAVIGPRDASSVELADAEAVGRLVGALGLPMICGGREGAMEAASRGCRAAGGLVIGVLPDADWRCANAHVDVPLPTGLGEARNAVIAGSAFALVAVGGGYGTLSEMAFGLRLSRAVIALPAAPVIDGVRRCADARVAIDAVAARYLDLP